MGAMMKAFRALVIFLSDAALDPIILFNAKNNSHRTKNKMSMEDFTG